MAKKTNKANKEKSHIKIWAILFLIFAAIALGLGFYSKAIYTGGAVTDDYIAACLSYFCLLVALFVFICITVSIFNQRKKRKVLACGKDGVADFVKIEGVIGGDKYRVVYEFYFPYKGLKVVKSPFIYSYDEAWFFSRHKRKIDIKYYGGKSYIVPQKIKTEKEWAKEFFSAPPKTASTPEYVEMPAVFNDGIGSDLLTELYKKQTVEDIMHFIQDINNRDLSVELKNALNDESELCIAFVKIQNNKI